MTDFRSLCYIYKREISIGAVVVGALGLLVLLVCLVGGGGGSGSTSASGHEEPRKLFSYPTKNHSGPANLTKAANPEVVDDVRLNENYTVTISKDGNHSMVELRERDNKHYTLYELPYLLCEGFGAYNRSGKFQVALRNFDAERKNVVFKVLVVDPKDRSHDDFSFAEGARVAKFLPHDDKFGVLVGESPASSRAFWFDLKGEHLENSSFPVGPGNFRTIFASADRVEIKGYYYVAPENETHSKIWMLSDALKPDSWYAFASGAGFDADAYDLSSGKFGVCYYDDKEKKSLTCKVIQAEGHLKNEEAKTQLRFDSPVSDVYLKNHQNYTEVVVTRTTAVPASGTNSTIRYRCQGSSLKCRLDKRH